MRTAKINIWLVGETISSCDRTKLPLARDVLKLFFHHQRIERETIAESAKKVAKKIESIWSETTIPTLLLRNIILKIVSLKKTYETLRKSRFRRTNQLQRETAFHVTLNKIFDIASQAGLRISNEQQDFLGDQRGPRQLDISSLKPLLPAFILPKEVEVNDSDSDESNENESEGSDDDYHPEQDPEYQTDNIRCNEILETVLNSTDVTSASDRVNITDGKFTILAAAFARACGADINRSTLSVSTVNRKRSHNRCIIVNDVKQDFYSLLEEEHFGLQIHFDGKRLKNYTANNPEDRTSKIERIAIVVSGQKIEQTLGIVTSDDGTGASIAEAANRMICDWDKWNQQNGRNKTIEIRNRIIRTCFDTTSANTGHLNGACKIFEGEYMKIKLLNFACRHHVFEVVIGGIFEMLFGESKGPNVGIFKRFKTEWRNIDKEKFQGLEKTSFQKPFAKLQREKTIEFLLHALSSETTYTPRDDYKEIMELCLLVLGHPLKNYKFKTPGANHHARWMSKIIYSFKIFLFRKQFALSPTEKSNFKEMCLFSSLIYVKTWIQCPSTSDAPGNDLNFYKLLQKYKVVSKTVSKVAIEKFKNHLWYLGPELVVLSLFSNKITPKEKLKILQEMKKKGDDWKVRGIRLLDSEHLQKKTLSDLIGCQSMSVIRHLKLNVDFIYNLEPDKWCDSKEYKTAKSVVDNIKVVNDVAERSLALMTIYNETLTRNENGKQNVIHVVEDNRKRIKGCQKKIMSAYNVR